MGPKIAVIGGGIGGLTAAVALARKGLAAEVYEQAPVLEEVGAGVGLWPNALTANPDPPLRTSASRAPPVQLLTVGQTSSNRSKTTPISSENVKPIAVH